MIMIHTNEFYLLFQTCLLFLFGRLVHEIGYVKWNSSEASEQVASLISLHLTLSGMWIVLCLAWKILMPMRNYMVKQWPDIDIDRDDILELPWYDVQVIAERQPLWHLFVLNFLLLFTFRNYYIYGEIKD